VKASARNAFCILGYRIFGFELETTPPPQPEPVTSDKIEG
jgi:hypothetical protein